jgi:hypothetical protein
MKTLGLEAPSGIKPYSFCAFEAVPKKIRRFPQRLLRSDLESIEFVGFSLSDSRVYRPRSSGTVCST